MSRLQNDLLNILRCPVTGSRLRQEQDELISEAAGPDGVPLRYPVRDGIAILLPAQPSDPDHDPTQSRGTASDNEPRA